MMPSGSEHGLLLFHARTGKVRRQTLRFQNAQVNYY